MSEIQSYKFEEIENHTWFRYLHERIDNANRRSLRWLRDALVELTNHVDTRFNELELKISAEGRGSDEQL